jgi:hypothetical protein
MLTSKVAAVALGVLAGSALFSEPVAAGDGRAVGAGILGFGVAH